MSKKERDHIVHLEDMRLSMERVLEYTNEMDFETFDDDHRTLYAFLMLFTVIGEAAKKIPEAIKSKYSEVPWKKMYALRNVVVHEYFGVKNEQLWQIVKNHLPKNKKQIDHILSIETKTQ